MGSQFKDYLNFLSMHKDLFNFQLTKIFMDTSVLKTHSLWLQFLSERNIAEINKVPFSCQMDSWPSSLQQFVITANSLCYNREMSDAKDNQFIETGSESVILSKEVVLSKEEKRGMNPKKCHEIEQLTLLVNNSCKKTSCCNVIDVGSGLGYLGQILSKRFGLYVCGLECEDGRTHGAETWGKKKDVNQSKFSTVTFTLKDDEDCCKDFRTLVCSLSKESNSSQYELDNIELKTSIPADTCSVTNPCHDISKNYKLDKRILENKHDQLSENDKTSVLYDSTLSASNDISDYPQKSNGVCMTGLHCCGDLTPTMLKFFLRCPELKSLVCLGCCYHNMTEKQGKSGFNMFPLSEELKLVFSEFDGQNIITKFALRLAAQETRTRWITQTEEDHKYHTNNVAFRGLIELFCFEENIPLVKEKRKVARRKDYQDLDMYISAVMNRMKFDLPEEYIRRRLHELYDRHKEDISLIEAVTCLQVVLQPVIESLIIKDRIAFLQEQNIIAEVVPVFYENISPRNLAIVAVKSES